MDTSFHTLPNLFIQLGLSAEQEAIDAFISTHYLGHDEKLENAPFWTPAQAVFLQECLQQDSDWSEVVDHLNLLLRKSYN